MREVNDSNLSEQAQLGEPVAAALSRTVEVLRGRSRPPFSRSRAPGNRVRCNPGYAKLRGAMIASDLPMLEYHRRVELGFLKFR
jgi:hypothetical protein